METVEKKRKLKKNVFRLVSGIENEERTLQDVMSALGVTIKYTVTRKRYWSPVEIEAIEKIFKSYGVTENIWTNVD